MFAKKHYNWLNQFLNLNNGIPSKDTFKRIISIINFKEIEPILVNTFIEKLNQYQDIFNDDSKHRKEKDIWAMDGKNCNSSGRLSSKDEENKSLQKMSLYSNNLGMSIVTEFIDDKSNEIPTGPKLLNLFNLENIIITFDALNTQEDTIKTIVKQNGFYVASIKGNQGNTYENLVNYFSDEQLLKQVKEENYCCNTEKNHSSHIKYEYFQTEVVNRIYNYKKWRDLNTIGCVKKTITNLNTNKTTRLIDKLRKHGIIKKVGSASKHYITESGRKLLNYFMLYQNKEIPEYLSKIYLIIC